MWAINEVSRVPPMSEYAADWKKPAMFHASRGSMRSK